MSPIAIAGGALLIGTVLRDAFGTAALSRRIGRRFPGQPADDGRGPQAEQ